MRLCAVCDGPGERRGRGEHRHCAVYSIAGAQNLPCNSWLVEAWTVACLCAAPLVTHQPYAAHGMTTLFGNGAGWAPGLGQAEAQLHQALHTCEQQVQQLLDGLRGAPDVPSKMQTTRVERQIKELQAQMRQHIRDLELMAEEQDTCVDGAWAHWWCMRTGHRSNHACQQLSGALALACKCSAAHRTAALSGTPGCARHSGRGVASSAAVATTQPKWLKCKAPNAGWRMPQSPPKHTSGTSGMVSTPSACAPLQRCPERCCFNFKHSYLAPTPRLLVVSREEEMQAVEACVRGHKATYER